MSHLRATVRRTLWRIGRAILCGLGAVYFIIDLAFLSFIRPLRHRLLGSGRLHTWIEGLTFAGAGAAGHPRSERTGKQAADALGRRLLAVIVYDQHRRMGDKLTLDDLDETEIGDWKMPDFKAACTYAAAQGWLIVQDDGLVLTPAGLASA